MNDATESELHPASVAGPSAPFEPPEQISSSRGARRSGTEPLGWWLALVALAIGVFIMQRVGQSPSAAVPDPADVSSIQLKLTGRLILGFRTLARQSPSLATAADDQIRQLGEQLTRDDPNHTLKPADFIDRIRAVPVIAEALGADAAAQRLGVLSAQLDDLESDGAFDYDPDTPEVDGQDDLDGFREDIASLGAIYGIIAPDTNTNPTDETGPASPTPEDVVFRGAGVVVTPVRFDQQETTSAQTDDESAAPGAATVTVAPADLLTPDQQDALTERHHWFAEMALSFGLDDTDPTRAALERGGVRALVVASVGLLLVGLVGLAGLILFPISMVLVAHGKIRSGYRRTTEHSAAPHGPFLHVIVLFLLGFIAMVLIVSGITAAGGPNIEFPVMWLLPGIALWPLTRGVSWDQLRAGLGWHVGRGVITEIGAGIVGYVTLLPIFAFGIVLTLILAAIIGGTATHPVQQQLEIHSAWDAIRLLLLASVWAPLTEETMFRGAFFNHMRRRFGPIIPALTTAFLFGFIHPQGIIAIPALMSLGFNFALLREWRGSLIAPMTAHALHNGFLMTAMMLVLA